MQWKVGSVCFLSIILVSRISSTVKNTTDTRGDEPLSVLIIGAGASGLSAAQTLITEGVRDFKILEAADYIGGRVHDVEFGGIRVEKGANWAQPVGGIVQKLVWAIGMKTHQSNWFSMDLYNSTGHNITEETFPVWNETMNAIVKGLSIADDLWKLNDPDMTVRSGLRSVGWNPKSPIKRTIEWASLDFENGDAPEFASLKGNALVKDEFNKFVPDDKKSTMVIDQRGYKYIFNATMPFLSDKKLRSNILLNKKVITIDQSSEDIVVVTCENGDVYRASRVLVTVSLAVLQNSRIEFIPQLPNWKIRTINRFRMASYSKIFLKFPKKFWSDKEIIIHASETRGRYPIFTNFEAKGLFPTGTNILMAELTGAESLRVEALTDEEIKAEIEAVLRVIYGDDMENATDIFVSGWSRNPLTLGAYSLWTPQMEYKCFTKMQSRVGNVFFAGEYTSEDNGFVQGALKSGVREGLKIASCCGGGYCPQWHANASCFCNDGYTLTYKLITIVLYFILQIIL